MKRMWPRKVSSLRVPLAGHGPRTARRMHWARIAAKGGLPHPGGEQGIQGRRSRVTRRLPPRRGCFSGVPAAPPHPLRRFLLPARERLLPGGGRDARCLGRLLRRARGVRGALRLRPSLQQDVHLEGEGPAGRGRLRSPRWRRTFRRLLVPGGTLRPGPQRALAAGRRATRLLKLFVLRPRVGQQPRSAPLRGASHCPKCHRPVSGAEPMPDVGVSISGPAPRCAGGMVA